MKISGIPPKKALLFGFFLIIIAYSLFQARFLILGPYIRIATPQNGAAADSPVVTVSGSSENIAFISLDDRPIYIDPHGNWSETLLASQGPNIIKLEGRDRFGRQTEKTVEVVLN